MRGFLPDGRLSASFSFGPLSRVQAFSAAYRHSAPDRSFCLNHRCQRSVQKLFKIDARKTAGVPAEYSVCDPKFVRFGPVNCFPLQINSLAAASPILRSKKKCPPPSGTSPMPIKFIASFASFSTSTWSQLSARLNPRPAAARGQPLSSSSACCKASPQFQKLCQ